MNNMIKKNYVKNIFHKIVKKFFLIFCNIISINKPTMFLGTSYGGWYFISPIKNKYLTVVSAGVGEDISFDIEFINAFNSKIILIDPTPRAIAHVESVMVNLGTKKSQEYNLNSGKQPIESYELSNITKDNFVLIKKALYNKTGLTVKFFLPQNHKHVSHSISNFQNNYKTNTDYIKVQTISVIDVMKENNLKQIDLLKLDIEGAENHVLPDMVKKKIFPDQILVEFDELSTNFVRPFFKAIVIFIKLLFNDYELIKTNNFPNYLFKRKIRSYNQS